MADDRHERERIVIESSIVAVTLLFIVAGIREVTGEPLATYALSMVGACFIIAAIHGALIMFLPPGSPPVLFASEFGFFMGGLAGLCIILLGISAHAIGGTLDVWMLTAVSISVVVAVAFICILLRLRKHLISQL